jgi:hypothetical protein
MNGSRADIHKMYHYDAFFWIFPTFIITFAGGQPQAGH